MMAAMASPPGSGARSRASRGALAAEVLLMRQREEATAYRALQGLRTQLEAVALQVTRAAQAVAAAEHVLHTARAALTDIRGGISAGLLRQFAEQVRRAEAQLQAQRTQADTTQQTFDRLRAQIDDSRRGWLLLRARRKAAELHRKQQQAQHRRLRAQIDRGLENEARDRFASAQRKRD